MRVCVCVCVMCVCVCDARVRCACVCDVMCHGRPAAIPCVGRGRLVRSELVPHRRRRRPKPRHRRVLERRRSAALNFIEWQIYKR
jgi:hypothetical protein